jgi:hypothetical protein
MLKKIMLAAMAAGAGIILAGCSSVDATNKFNGLQISETKATPVAHISAQIWGLYCFGLPVWVGSAENVGGTTLFKNTCKYGNLTNIVTAKAKNYGATKVLDMNSSEESNLLVPFFFFSIKKMTVSGNAVK